MTDGNEYLGWVDKQINQINDLKTIIENKIGRSEMLEAKSKLYSLLINLNEDEITDNEVDIMLLLSKDEQIQKNFRK